MIKRILIISFAFTFNYYQYAQGPAMELSAGPKISWITGRFDLKNFENTKIESITQKEIRLLISYPLTESWNIRTGMTFSEQGFSFNNTYIGFGYDGTYKSTYIQIPSMLAYQFGNSIKIKVYLGVSFDFLLKVSNQTTFFSTSEPDLKIYDYSYDPSNEFNDFVLSGVLGAGMEIPINRKFGIILDVSYNQSITKAVKDTDYDYDPNFWTEETPNNFQNVRNCSVAFNLGVVYSFSREDK